MDFAFEVHTDIGLTCVGAKVNGRIVPLDYVLRNGEFVEILTSKNANPSRDWLNFVKTSKARSKIRSWLKEQQREESLLRGARALGAGSQESQPDPKEILTPTSSTRWQRSTASATAMSSLATIGFGRVTALQVLQKLVGKGRPRHQAP